MEAKFSGTGKANRKSAKVFMNVGTKAEQEWEILGKDNDELSRTLNNEVESTTNVLGETETEVTKGAQTTTVDPYKWRRESKVSHFMYEAYKYDYENDQLRKQCMEVFEEDVQKENEYGAFVQDAIVDLKSWGGDTKAIGNPFDLNWVGEKIHGTFNPVTKKFTKEGEVPVV